MSKHTTVGMTLEELCVSFVCFFVHEAHLLIIATMRTHSS